MTEKRFNCHVKFSAMPNGIMVLDYERHGDEQTVIDDISREKAHRVMDRLNELNDEKEWCRNKLNTFLTKTNELKDENNVLKAANGEMEDYVARLEEENEKLKKSISEYAFLSDCSVQVLNEEEDVKEDYLTLSCKELHKLKKENELLKMHMKSARVYLEGGYTKKAIERLQIADR